MYFRQGKCDKGRSNTILSNLTISIPLNRLSNANLRFWLKTRPIGGVIRQPINVCCTSLQPRPDSAIERRKLSDGDAETPASKQCFEEDMAS